MIKEAYCSYEIYKLLREKGFDGEIHTTYDDEGYTQPSITHQMACAWLREKGYHIYTFKLDHFWIYEIQSLTKDWTFSFGGFENHNAAIEAAIKYCLENLI